jgi:serine/threonine protein kinase
LCHRNLSLETVKLDGDHLDITALGWSLRYNQKAKDTDKAPPPPGNSNPQYIPPEFFHSSDGSWDGFAGDLWACGLMLYSMVVSTEALFAAPVSEDSLFGELCVKGKIGEQAEKHGKVTGKDIKLSDGLIDLLRQMMKADPSDRLSLKMVTEHKWVKDGEETVPPELAASTGK